MSSSETIDVPDIGRVELPEHFEDYDDYIERACHILKVPPGLSSSSAPTWTLCGLSLRRRPHAMGSAGEYVCPSCSRPRCPECVVRYGRGQR